MNYSNKFRNLNVFNGVYLKRICDNLFVNECFVIIFCIILFMWDKMHSLKYYFSLKKSKYMFQNIENSLNFGLKRSEIIKKILIIIIFSLVTVK